MCERDASAYGGFLGFANTAFIAICVGASHEYHLLIGFFTFVFGLVPALITGSVLGALGLVIGTWHPWLRRLVLIVPAVAVLLGLAACFGMVDVFLLSIIPTVVAALLLERRTRSAPAMPVAIAK
jgi:ABC-type dipeptide/oligopeptide/nickel transport system permease subunit